MSRKQERGSAQRKGGGALGKLFGAMFALLFLATAGAGGAWLYGQQVYTAAGPATQDGSARTLVVDQGDSVGAIATKLEASGAISDAMHFRLAARITETGPKMKHGEYEIASGASLRDIVDQLVEGRVILHAITMPEGLTTAMIMQRLAEDPLLTGDMPEVMPAEGVLLPETYMVSRGETRADMVARMIRSQQTLIAELWPTRQPGLPFDTPEEALNLASIVEKETGVAAERPQVAAVFVNRLRRGMRLESDPTIIYGVCLQRPDSCADGKLVNAKGERRPIFASEIALDTGYNTYRIDRLPPTPISNPGADSIRAVLNPPVSDALFFVADGSGGHAFAATYAEHLRNVARWRDIEATALQQERSQ